MAYAAAAIFALASQCAPTVAPETVLAIVQTESSAEPFALNVNGGRQPARQGSAADAAATARRYVAAGYSVWTIASTVSGATVGAHCDAKANMAAAE